MEIAQQEILRRRDMRDVLTFTIDPADAKDFDDAISFLDPEDGTYQIGVHIADVSHYVRPGDTIDIYAYERATSVYLVDRVEPMLPEELCNDICSLVPHEDRLCMSVVFTIGHDGKILKYKICRTVIHSDYRLTYEQAEEIVQSAECRVQSEELEKALKTLNLLAKMFRQKRMADGAIDLDQEEIRFRLDEQGEPVEIFFHKPTDANHLIEEFMLLANRTVATHLKNEHMVYRVHDIPDPDKMRTLHNFTRRMSLRVDHSVIDMLTVRAMAKAEYSTRNIGHYGLQFRYYTHFTSPIRRYPDLIVHRLCEKYVFGKNTHGAVLPFTPFVNGEVLEEACKHCSEMELEAQQAERDSIREMQTRWMEKHVGEEFDASIVNVTDYGMFVRLVDSRCEGLVHISTICPGDYMEHDEKNYRLIAERSGRTFTLGDKVRVRCNQVDIPLRRIDFTLVEEV